MTKITNITAIILAGGKSSRMGYDKAFAQIGGKSLIEIIYQKLSGIFGKVIIIANEKLKFEFLNCDVFEDIYKNKGPLGGIFTGLTNSLTEVNFFISCDMPFIDKDLIYKLLECDLSKEAVLFNMNGNIQPLFGLYNKKLLKKIESIISSNYTDKKYLSIKHLLESSKVDIIEMTHVPDDFCNINTQEELIRILTSIK